MSQWLIILFGSLLNQFWSKSCDSELFRKPRCYSFLHKQVMLPDYVRRSHQSDLTKTSKHWDAQAHISMDLESSRGKGQLNWFKECFSNWAAWNIPICCYHWAVSAKIGEPILKKQRHNYSVCIIYSDACFPTDMNILNIVYSIGFWMLLYQSQCIQHTSGCQLRTPLLLMRLQPIQSSFHFSKIALEP